MEEQPLQRIMSGVIKDPLGEKSLTREPTWEAAVSTPFWVEKLLNNNNRFSEK